MHGRFAYLGAIEKHWPEVLTSLRTEVLPIYKPDWKPGNPIPLSESWERLQSDQDRKPLLAAMQSWAARFRITEEWILGAALETLLIYSPDLRPELEARRNRNLPWYWRYRPDYNPAFEPILEKNYWYPPDGGWDEEWNRFRRRMESQFKSQLGQYRRTIEHRFSVGREKIVFRVAGWTARYQRGETAIEIAGSEDDINHLKDPEQVVFRAISRFSKSIGLNLRRRGAHPKRTVQPKPPV